MKAFSFRLDSVLKYRDYLEKKAQRDLYEAMRICREVERKIESLRQKKIEAAKKCSKEGIKGMHVSEFQIYRRFVEGLEHDIEKACKRLIEAEEKVKEKEEALKKQAIKKKTLETLKDRQWKNYLKQLEREDQKLMDDMAIMRGGVRK